MPSVKVLPKNPRSATYSHQTIALPEAIIFSKIAYNTLLMIGISFIGIGFIRGLWAIPWEISLYLLSLEFGAVGFSATLSMVAGIAAQEYGNINGRFEFPYYSSFGY
jgi:hypothetical protein